MKYHPLLNLMCIPICSILMPMMLMAAPTQADTVWAYGVSEEGGWYDTNKTFSDEDHDSQLCWAAAAGNVLRWWQGQYIIPEGTPDGDEIWETFKSSFTNYGSTSDAAWIWWLSGEYAPVVGPGEQWAELTDDGKKAGGYYLGVDGIGNYLVSYDIIEQPYLQGDIYDATAILCDYLLDRCGVTLHLSSVPIYVPGIGYTSISHAITLWGIEYDAETMAMTRLYVTDSDDAANVGDLGLFALEVETREEDGKIFLSDTEEKWYTRGMDVYLSGFSALSANIDDALPARAVPEPATASLGVLGLCALLMRRRRQME